MNTSSNGYVLGFAVAVCVTISAMLAATAHAHQQPRHRVGEVNQPGA